MRKDNFPPAAGVMDKPPTPIQDLNKALAANEGTGAGLSRILISSFLREASGRARGVYKRNPIDAEVLADKLYRVMQDPEEERIHKGFIAAYEWFRGQREGAMYQVQRFRSAWQSLFFVLRSMCTAEAVLGKTAGLEGLIAELAGDNLQDSTKAALYNEIRARLYYVSLALEPDCLSRALKGEPEKGTPAFADATRRLLETIDSCLREITTYNACVTALSRYYQIYDYVLYEAPLDDYLKDMDMLLDQVWSLYGEITVSVGKTEDEKNQQHKVLTALFGAPFSKFDASAYSVPQEQMQKLLPFLEDFTAFSDTAKEPQKILSILHK